MPKYLVKFIPDDVPLSFSSLEKASIKIGTFQHYKNIECKIRQDREEGQRGLDLIVKKPSSKLDELIANNVTAPDYPKDSIDKNGNFNFEYHILDHEHLMDFNAWVFCCSIVDDLEEIPSLQERFKCKNYYFIPDLDKFVNSVQRLIAQDLKDNPLNECGELRVKHPENGKVYLDGYKDIVTYTNESKYTRLTCDTLEEYFLNYSRKLSRELWFKKSKRFEPAKEFRVIFFSCEQRNTGAIYTTIDDSLVFPIDLSGLITKDPEPFSE